MTIIDLPKIDVCTLIYNAENFIDKYFEGFKNLNYPQENIRINLLDNSSDNSSYDYIKKNYINNQDFKFEINLEKSNKNLGFSGGNNYLFKKYQNDDSYPFFFLLNQDGSLEKDCFMHLANTIKNNDRTALLEAVQTPKEHPKCYDIKTLETSWCSGGGVLIRKSALREVGGFDHKFFLYCEDVDLSWKMWTSGWQCKICPDAKYEHITEELDADKDQSIRYFYSFRNGFFMNIKYNSIYGLIRYYMIAFAVCFKQDPERKKAFLKAYFAAQLYAPYYLLRRLFKTRKKSKWIIFNNFEFGNRREFQDTADGKRIFI